MPDYTAFIYLLVLATIFSVYAMLRRRKQNRSLAIRDTAIAEGLTEPASLHPIINPNLCIGCQACIKACPEQNVLGLVGGKAALIDPTHCIGHGACKTACPTQGIELVFGTETRGLDIPFVDPSFETNVPGVYIAGELGGMGLIRNAVTQGSQALDCIQAASKGMGSGKDGMIDVLIIGAGPAGFAGSLAAMKHKLNYVTIEQETLGGTVAHYPRGKIVMTQPVDLPLYGKVKLRETTKEKLLELWESVEAKTGVKINYQERVESVTSAEGGGFEVKTTKATYQTRNVLLTIGRRGTPRTLDVPGEEQNKVVYRLIDPEQYRNQNVLVVGGGDSALEAAWSIAAEPGTKVTLSYRRDAFDRAKAQNRDKVKAAEQEGSLDVFFKSGIKAIGEKHVEIEHSGETLEVPNDAVIVCAGGILPNAFLKSIGITIETKYGTV